MNSSVYKSSGIASRYTISLLIMDGVRVRELSSANDPLAGQRTKGRGGPFFDAAVLRAGALLDTS